MPAKVHVGGEKKNKRRCHEKGEDSSRGRATMFSDVDVVKKSSTVDPRWNARGWGLVHPGLGGTRTSKCGGGPIDRREEPPSEEREKVVYSGASSAWTRVEARPRFGSQSSRLTVGGGAGSRIKQLSSVQQGRRRRTIEAETRSVH
ncbi:hypothetical protein MPTK1_3g23990 [Marchantia polymorpha subsp. ruderalis]|uniref:Uncharacterized protein n=2 Tax=Marchantia polymorpha TaxID=3197 RepID=A0AAF6B464_MARPO|nr:hypothetical protein MARPO_0121s0025 [Marchantia polymorpha]BBN06798.1 hypothetical protein Mp_3g23990 [Marchantia polymorpha subsp. ruderalis]|eukprot:PTQ30677.1 hypothetical protein MARPO_0121s0025 [Marchantia polymorpha]